MHDEIAMMDFRLIYATEKWVANVISTRARHAPRLPTLALRSRALAGRSGSAKGLIDEEKR